MASTAQSSDSLTFRDLREDIRQLSWRSLTRDLNAGVIVALLAIPQALAYSLVAGIPLTCGLFSAIFAGGIAAFFGSSRLSVVGPTSAMAILVQAGISDILYTYYRDATGDERDILAVQILAQLCLLVALFQLLSSVLRLGRLTQFVSQAVIVGYITGTAIALFVGQVYVFIGLNPPSGTTSLFEKITYLLGHLGGLDTRTTSIGVVSLVFLVVMRRLRPGFPAAALMLVLSGAAVAFFQWTPYPHEELLDPYAVDYVHRVVLVGDSGRIAGLVPRIVLPAFDPVIMSRLLPVAFAIALLGMLETSSVARSLSSVAGHRVAMNQEFLGLGLGNFVGALVGAMPGAGSPSRSALNASSGANSRFAAVTSALVVAGVVTTMGYGISFIPLASLAALLIVTAVHLLQPKQILLCIKATKADAFVFAATVVAYLVLSVDIAFYVGTTLSVVLYLNQAATPSMTEMHEQPLTPDDRTAGLRVVDVRGELYFGASDLFQATLHTLAKETGSLRVLLIRLRHARDLDATCCIALLQLFRFLRGKGVDLMLCGVSPESWEVLRRAGVIKALGEERVCLSDISDENPEAPLVRVRRRLGIDIHATSKSEERLRSLQRRTQRPALA